MFNPRRPNARRMLVRILIAPALFAAMLSTLSGCARGLTLQPGQLDLSACTDLSQQDVRYLERPETARCNQAGRPIKFPSGDVIEVSPLGSNTGTGTGDTYRYFFDNLGTYGVVAAQVRRADNNVRWWGTKKALDQYWDAFGKGAP